MRRGASPHTVEAGEESAATRYEVSERAGEGTVWVTYRVRMRGTNRVVALKALKSNFSRHATLPQSLAINLERAAAAEHPNLALPIDLGEEEGTLFFVSDWVSNISLENKLRRAPFNRNDTLNYMRQLAAALQALHENGLAHGDVRPHQIMLAGNSQIKLTDAGVAQGFHDARVGLNDIISDVAFYYAPERWEGGGPTPAADLYAAGVILYRMLAGRVPFDGPSPLSIAMRHRNDAPLMPSQFNPSCPEDLEVIALRLLEKSPSARFASAAELLEALNGGAKQAASTASGSRDSNAGAVADVDSADLDEEVTVAPRRRRRKRDDLVTEEILDEPYDEKAERKKQRRREGLGALFALFWTLMSVGLLAGILYGAYYFWIQDIPKEVKVPSYVGKNQFEAERLLASKGLKMRITREVYDPKRPSGTVISGERKAGQVVRAGREIGVTVSRGEEPITMYNFTELTLDQVRRIMQRDGLRLGQITEQYHDQIPAGYICGQYPEPGEPFRRSDPINLTVSKGPQPTGGAEGGGLLPPIDSSPNSSAASGGDQPSYRSPETVPDVMLVPRAVSVRVAIPSGARRQEVRIEVQDAEGTHTVYRRTHDPGDLIDEKIQVTRQQGATAMIRVYVGGSLYREIRV